MERTSFGLSRNLLNLFTAILGLVLLVEVALVVPELPPRTVVDGSRLMIGPGIVLLLLAFCVYLRTEGLSLLSFGRPALDNRAHVWGLVFLIALGPLLGAGIFYVLQILPTAVALPTTLVLLALIPLFVLAATKTHLALLLFLLLLPLLSFIHSETSYGMGLQSSTLVIPLEKIDPVLFVNGTLSFANPIIGYLLTMPVEATFVGVLALGWLIKTFANQEGFYRTPLDVPILVFLLAAFVSSLFSSRWDYSLVYMVEAILAPIVLYYIAVSAMTTKRRVSYALAALIPMGAVTALYHFHKIGQIGSSWAELLSTSESLVNLFRRSWLFGNANLEASALVLLLPIVFYFTLGERRRSVKLLAGLLLLFLVLETIFNSSRGAWLAGGGQIAVLFFFGFQSRRSFLYSALPGLAVATVFFWQYSGIQILAEQRTAFIFGAEDLAVGARWDLWRITLGMMDKYWLVGMGLGNFLVEVPTPLGYIWPLPDAHNLLLSVLAEAGLVPFVALVAILVITFKEGIAVLKEARGTPTYTIALVLLVSLGGFFVNAMTTGAEFGHNRNITTTVLWWAVMGLFMAVRRLVVQGETPPSRVSGGGTP